MRSSEGERRWTRASGDRTGSEPVRWVAKTPRPCELASGFLLKTAGLLSIDGQPPVTTMKPAEGTRRPPDPLEHRVHAVRPTDATAGAPGEPLVRSEIPATQHSATVA
jgi:hypothetical protein